MHFDIEKIPGCNIELNKSWCQMAHLVFNTDRDVFADMVKQMKAAKKENFKIPIKVQVQKKR